MEAITDFFKEIKSRLSNPLLGSFAISWLVINWKIPVGLIGYKQADLKVDGYNSYIDLINVNASCWLYFWKPFIWAVIYTFGFPVLKMGITAFLNGVKKRSDNWNTKILKDYYVPMNKFVKQKELYKELAQKLQDIYVEDGAISEENTRLKGEMVTLNNELSKCQNDLSSYADNNHKLDKERTLAQEQNKELTSKVKSLEYGQAHQNDIYLLNKNWELILIHNEIKESSYIRITQNSITHSSNTYIGKILLVSFDFKNKRLRMVAKMFNLKQFVIYKHGHPIQPVDEQVREIELSFSPQKEPINSELDIYHMRGEIDGLNYEFRSTGSQST